MGDWDSDEKTPVTDIADPKRSVVEAELQIARVTVRDLQQQHQRDQQAIRDLQQQLRELQQANRLLRRGGKRER